MAFSAGARPSALVLAGRVGWVNLREAGRAYRYQSVAGINSITMVFSGSALYTIEGIDYSMQSGRASFVSPGCPISISTASNDPFTFGVVTFSLFDGEGRSVTLKGLGFPKAANLGRTTKIRRCFDALLTAFRSNQTLSHQSMRLLELLDGLWETTVLTGSHDCAGSPRPPVALERATAFVYANLNLKITLQDMAKAACLDPSYFNRLFKKTTGETPMGFVRRLKIERSRTVLLNSDLTIQQVSEMYGFESAAHYSRMFKDVTGKNPRAYLRDMRG